MKNSRFLTLLVIVLVIALIITVVSLIMDRNGKFNAGNYRMLDAVVTSTVNVKDNSDVNKTIESLSDIKLSLSQNNKISFLTTKDDNISEIYIDNISIKNPEKVGELYISVINSDKKELISNIKDKINIMPNVQENGDYIEVNIDNELFEKELSIPENAKSVKFDGTILPKYSIDLKSLIFDVSFDLNILQKDGKINTCNVKLNLPNEDLVLVGTSITRKNLANFNFKIK